MHEVAPELIQGAFTSGRLAAALAPLLDDAAARNAARARLSEVRRSLGAPGAAARAAARLREMVA